MEFRLRRLVFFVTLLASFWVLAQARHDVGRFRVATDADATAVSLVPIAEVGSGNAADMGKAPFDVFDNSCRYEAKALELSGCTGFVAGDATGVYRFAVGKEGSLYVMARPLREDFDVAVSLLRVGEQGQLICVEGRDEEPEGRMERLQVDSLQAGVYYLAVGGYGSDCGQFELSVESELPSPVSLQEFTTTPRNGGRVIRWETRSEADVRYFKLCRAGSDDEKPIFQPRGRGGFSRGARYEYFDEDVHQDSSYDLIAVDSKGRETKL
jgi:hypothetical protein